MCFYSVLISRHSWWYWLQSCLSCIEFESLASTSWITRWIKSGFGERYSLIIQFKWTLCNITLSKTKGPLSTAHTQTHTHAHSQIHIYTPTKKRKKTCLFFYIYIYSWLIKAIFLGKKKTDYMLPRSTAHCEKEVARSYGHSRSME